eukprot:3024711-Pyramimonas_sp.AAC.1
MRSPTGGSQVFDNSSVKHAVYVDNFAVVSLGASEAASRIWYARAVLEGIGIGCHKVSEGQQCAEFTGLFFDGERRVIRIGPKRMWKLRLALGFVLGTAKASGNEIGKLIGHFTGA